MQLSPAWLSSLLSLFFLALLIHLWLRPERWAPRLGTLLLIAASVYGFHWIFISLHEYGQMPGPIAGLATLLLALYVAGYGLVAGQLIRKVIAPRLARAGQSHRLPLVIAGLITLLEWLRGQLFTGFPWLNWGYQQIDSWLAGYAPWLGVYGVVFVTALCAALIARSSPRGLATVLVLHLVGGLLALLTLGEASPFVRTEGRPLQAALIQGGISQQLKFDPAQQAANERIHLGMGQALAAGAPGTRLIVFPETAFITSWDRLHPQTRSQLEGLAQQTGAVVMTGIPLEDPDGWRNALLTIRPDQPVDPTLGSADRYNKHHLVPFGEFIPWGFRWFVDLMQMPLGDFRVGEALQPAISVADQRIGVNICFEDLFGEELARAFTTSRTPAEQPTVLLNLSNLAWFGDTVALPQHLATARMRSLELGRPMLRATNTGATAAIDHRGRVMDQLPAMEPSILLTQVQGMTGLTPYAYWTNWPAVLLACLAFLLPIGLTAKMRQ